VLRQQHAQRRLPRRRGRSCIVSQPQHRLEHGEVAYLREHGLHQCYAPRVCLGAQCICGNRGERRSTHCAAARRDPPRAIARRRGRTTPQRGDGRERPRERDGADCTGAQADGGAGPSHHPEAFLGTRCEMVHGVSSPAAAGTSPAGSRGFRRSPARQCVKCLLWPLYGDLNRHSDHFFSAPCISLGATAPKRSRASLVFSKGGQNRYGLERPCGAHCAPNRKPDCAGHGEPPLVQLVSVAIPSLAGWLARWGACERGS
jgi:hypothetical protein